MSLEAVKEITDLEQSLEQAKADAAAAARKRVADADKAGAETIAAAKASAAEQVKEMMAQAEERADGVIRQVGIDTDREESALKDHARANMDKAVDLIVEKVMELS